MKRLICLMLLVGGCSENGARQADVAAVVPAATPQADASRVAQWARSCALCHVDGEGGAPVVGDLEAWAPRLAQGEDVLMAHTLEGYNNMPPLGYCMDCERDDFRALIHLMAKGNAR